MQAGLTHLQAKITYSDGMFVIFIDSVRHTHIIIQGFSFLTMQVATVGQRLKAPARWPPLIPD